MNRMLLSVVCLAVFAIGGAALAQPPDMVDTVTDATAPPPQRKGKLSCDDMITNAELKIQPVIDYDKKHAATEDVHAAMDAMSKGDAAACRADIQKAMDDIKN